MKLPNWNKGKMVLKDAAGLTTEEVTDIAMFLGEVVSNDRREVFDSVPAIWEKYEHDPVRLSVALISIGQLLPLAQHADAMQKALMHVSRRLSRR